MSYDMDMCSGADSRKSVPCCPLRNNCKRYVLGKKALSENFYPIWWMNNAPYENGDCELQIKITDEQRND